MPSIITHSVVGLFGANLQSEKNYKKKFYFFAIFLSIVPDFDVIGFKFKVPYDSFFGHRGFFHSLFFGLLISVIVTEFFFRKDLIKQWDRLKLTLFFFFITASHGLLDALTSGGLGIALFSPFSTTRYFFPITPIKVSPIGIKAFLSNWGVQVLKSEIICVWLPLLTIWILIKIQKYLKNKFWKETI